QERKRVRCALESTTTLPPAHEYRGRSAVQFGKKAARSGLLFAGCLSLQANFPGEHRKEVCRPANALAGPFAQIAGSIRSGPDRQFAPAIFHQLLLIGNCMSQLTFPQPRVSPAQYWNPDSSRQRWHHPDTDLQGQP